jgi:hypothetical protein
MRPGVLPPLPARAQTYAARTMRLMVCYAADGGAKAPAQDMTREVEKWVGMTRSTGGAAGIATGPPAPPPVNRLGIKSEP